MNTLMAMTLVLADSPFLRQGSGAVTNDPGVLICCGVPFLTIIIILTLYWLKYQANVTREWGGQYAERSTQPARFPDDAIERGWKLLNHNADIGKKHIYYEFTTTTPEGLSWHMQATNRKKPPIWLAFQELWSDSVDRLSPTTSTRSTTWSTSAVNLPTGTVVLYGAWPADKNWPRIPLHATDEEVSLSGIIGGLVDRSERLQEYTLGDADLQLMYTILADSQAAAEDIVETCQQEMIKWMPRLINKHIMVIFDPSGLRIAVRRHIKDLTTILDIVELGTTLTALLSAKDSRSLAPQPQPAVPQAQPLPAAPDRRLLIQHAGLKQGLAQAQAQGSKISPYVHVEDGQMYLSLAFVRDPSERAQTYDLLQRFQAGETVDEEALRQLGQQLRT